MKPANVLLTATDHEHGTSAYGFPKITDFGLAKMLDEDRGQTSTGEILGTPGYMAPEQAEGQVHDIGPAVDTYALGALLYELLTGRPPFRGATPRDTILRVVADPPVPPSQLQPKVPRDLETICLKCLEKKAQDRYPSAQCLADDLGRFRAGEPIRARPVGLVRRTVRWAKRWRAVGLVLIVALAALALFLLLPMLTEKPKQDPPTPPPDPTDVAESIGLRFIRVPKGTFWMGGGDGIPGEKQVEIKEDFDLGATPVTQGQWRAIMDENPSWFSREGGGAEQVKDISDEDLDKFPVESVSWNDVRKFLVRLNEKEKGNEKLYRLPTEAEWEYACRGGATSKEECSFNFYLATPTNDLSSREANFNGNFPAGNAAKGPNLGCTCKVGSYPPNRLGLYDMNGNVWQWCEDKFDLGGSGRVIRGGSWNGIPRRCRAADRGRVAPSIRYDSLGCRLARVSFAGQGK